MMAKKVRLYSLTTCAYCQAIKKMFIDLNVEYEVVEADLLEGAEREAMLAELRTFNPQCSFPTVVVGEEVVAGYKVQAIKEAIGIRTDVDALYEMLKNVQEPQGYFFNRDRERTFALLRGLLINKDRYGYMACPCRLATGEREQDKDILCPCVYRQPDVEEFGACYCQLYVSARWNNGEIPQQSVPERRTLRK